MTQAALNAIEAAWANNIFAHEDVLEYSARALNYEVAEPQSDAEIEAISHNQEINFFEYVVSRNPGERQISGADNFLAEFAVEIRYTREAGTDGTSWRAVRAALMLIQSLAITGLGPSWLNTVDYSTPTAAEISITQGEFAGKPVNRGVIRFQGFKETTL